MRHFLSEELVLLSVAVAGLASGVQPMGSKLAPIGRAGAAERLTPPDGPAVTAKPLATIAAAAEAELDAASLAEGEPVLR